MNTHRITAMAMAVALAGFTCALSAEENISTAPVNDALQQNADGQKPETENTMSEMDMPAQTVVQPADNLLSDLKVYPSF
ncbi:MAG: hypothetical protein Tsb0026_14020 [Sulfuricaulis sp.]